MGCVEGSGGVLSLEDLRAHSSTFDAPIRTTYRSMDVWEMPPNGQGLTALLALNILEGFNFSGKSFFFFFSFWNRSHHNYGLKTHCTVQPI